KKVQVDLPRQRISRLHLGISREGIAYDWRSVYGSTVNGVWPPYGEERPLVAGDILVLSGLEVLQYRPVDSQWWHFLGYLVGKPRVFPDEARPLPGLAMLVDGERREVHPIFSKGQERQFVTVRDGRLGLSDEQTEDAVMAVQHQVFRDR